MAYDRRGRKAVDPGKDPEQPTATPNAARIQGGRPLGGRAALKGRRRGGNRSGQSGAGQSVRAGARPRRFVVRILPVVAFVAALLVSVKVAGIWERIADGRSPVTVTAFAEADSPASSASAAPEAASGASAQPAPTQLAQAAPSSQNPVSEQPLDPVLFTRSEIELLQDLSKRRKELDAREQAVIQKEGLLTAAEDRIEKKIVELEGVRSDIEKLIKTYDEQEEEEIKGLVQIYEKMKPKDAARIFDQLDMEILLRVFDRMKASKSAPVLASMRPRKAQEVTARIAERRVIRTTSQEGGTN